MKKKKTKEGLRFLANSMASLDVILNFNFTM